MWRSLVNRNSAAAGISIKGSGFKGAAVGSWLFIATPRIKGAAAKVG
jgi:hypothetical protein